MKVFLDTNVLAAAIGTRGLCADLFAIVIEEHELIICRALELELERVSREKFRLPDRLIGEYLGLVRELGRVCESERSLDFVPDPDDEALIASALDAACDCFVTGDKALQQMAGPETLPIMSPRQFWNHLHQSG